MPDTRAAGGVTAVCRIDEDAQPPAWRIFRDPIVVLQARSLGDVPGVLREAERHARAGRWCVGYVAYEAAPAFDDALRTASPEPGLPLAWFAVHERAEPTSEPAPGGVTAGPWSVPTRAAYAESLARIRDEIVDGNTFQVNHTERLSASIDASAEDLFAELYRRQPTQYAALLHVGAHAIASVSPELFFARRGERVTMRPMKGTIARGSGAADDESRRRWLLSSAKNRAENTMIVDLLRNDLGRVAEPGSVRVTDLVRLETYPTFHALTSAITADAPDADLVDLFTALFPCGSVTGAPKASTMGISARLEPTPRGVYCGAVGFLAPGGDARFSVAIRTGVLDEDGVLTYGVGGGITADSRPDEEYAEVLTKARVVLTLPGSDLLETLRLQDGELRHLEEHLARMRASAEALGFHYQPDVAARVTEQLRAAHPNGAWRARLLLSRSGEFRAEALPFVDEPGKVMTARLSANPVRSDDVRLRHKLTDRSIYDTCREDGVDTTLLVNERGEVTEFLFGNIVVRRGAEWLTPPLRSGLLPGIGRALAIADGAREEPILASELHLFDEVWHVNSLRGHNRVRMVGGTK